MSTQLATIKEISPVIDKMKGQLKMALPAHMSADRLARIALTELRQVPKLRTCTRDSFLKCLMVSAQLGLEPGMLGHVYFIPFGKEATIVIGYKGMLELAQRSGKILSIEARVVKENDKCTVKLGLDSDIQHEIDIRSPDRGKTIGYYACAKIVGGGKMFEFMSVAEVEEIRKSSKAGNSGPWVTHPEEMGKKTVIRRLFKYLPVSVELQKATNLDEAADVGIQSNVIEGEFEVDEETGEILEIESSSHQADALADKLK